MFFFLIFKHCTYVTHHKIFSSLKSHLLILIDHQQARHMGMVQGQVDLHLPSSSSSSSSAAAMQRLKRFFKEVPSVIIMDIYGFF